MTDFRVERGPLAASAYVASVQAGNSKLTISPNVGAVVVTPNVGIDWQWTVGQTFFGGILDNNGNLFYDGVGNIFAANFPSVPFIDAGASLYSVQSGAQIFDNNGYFYYPYPIVSVLADGAGLLYPGGSYYLADATHLYAPSGSILIDNAGNLQGIVSINAVSAFLAQGVYGSIQICDGGNGHTQDGDNFNYSIGDQIFLVAAATSYLSGNKPIISDVNGQAAFESRISCGQDVEVNSDNWSAGVGAKTMIACGGNMGGSTDDTGIIPAAGNGAVSYISCGGESNVYQGCTPGTQGTGGLAFIGCGGLNVATDGIGVGGTVQVCGVVDNITSGSFPTATGTFNINASTTNILGGVNFLGSSYAATLEIGTLTVDTAINLIDVTTMSNVPTVMKINRSNATGGEKSGMITFGGDGAPSGSAYALNYGFIVPSYAGSVLDGYGYFAFPNVFGSGGYNNNPVLTMSPASSGSVAGYIYNHVGINCVPDAANYDLQFNTSATGIRSQRYGSGSGSAPGPFEFRAGGAAAGQTNVNGGNTIISSGEATGSGSSDVIIQAVAAGGSGTTDRLPAEYLRVKATGTELKNKLTKINNIATDGWGTETVYKHGRSTAQTAAVGSVAAYTPTADGSFIISMNVLVTTSTLHNFTATVAYTDEGNTARTVTLQFSTLAGAFVTAMTNAQGTVPYEGVPLHIRVKASTAITLATTGTFTTVTYNVEGSIRQIA